MIMRIDEIPGDTLADYQLSWVRLREILDDCEDDDGCVILCYRGLHPISGVDLADLERAFEAGVSRRRIASFLRGMAREREAGR
jgi:hypothetical protein